MIPEKRKDRHPHPVPHPLLRILPRPILEKRIHAVDKPSSPRIGQVPTVSSAAKETSGATSSTFARRVRNE
jgi:hypothetical protein